MTLAEVYEDKYYPMPPSDPVEAILFRMDQMGLERKDLESFLIYFPNKLNSILNQVYPGVKFAPTPWNFQNNMMRYTSANAHHLLTMMRLVNGSVGWIKCRPQRPHSYKPSSAFCPLPV
jgi:hypothetical protein